MDKPLLHDPQVEFSTDRSDILFLDNIHVDDRSQLGIPERMPRGARRLATFYWRWSPWNSRLSDFRISLDSKRLNYVLWERWFDDNLVKWFVVARVAAPRRGTPRVRAGMELIHALLKWEQIEAPLEVELCDGGLSREQALHLVSVGWNDRSVVGTRQEIDALLAEASRRRLMGAIF